MRHAAAIAAASSNAIAIRDSQVCGNRLTCCGSGMSIRPATGSACVGCTSAKGCLRLAVAATARVTGRECPKEATELRSRFLGSTQRQHRNADLVRPCEDAVQALMGRLLDALADAVASDMELDLQLAIRHRHAGRRRQVALQGIVDEKSHDVVMPGHR